MQAIGAVSKTRHVARVLQNLVSPSFQRVDPNQHRVSNACAFIYTRTIIRNSSHTETKNITNALQSQPISKSIPFRLFSSESNATKSDLGDADTAKAVYDKIQESVTVKRTAPPNAWLWSLIAKCSTQEDIKLLFDILQKLRTFRLSNLRIPDDYNSALCREVTKACVRAGSIDFGKKTLWKHNLFGLELDIGSAHYLLLHAKQNNDVKLMVEVMKILKKNDLTLQPGTAEIVLSICNAADRWDLICKYGKRFVKSGVRLRQASFDLWMEFATRKGCAESLWKIEKWRSEAMKQHTLSTAFSCAKGFLLEHKPANAASVIQEFYQTHPDAKKSDIMNELQKLVTEWPLQVIKQQKENKKAFAAALQRDFSVLINTLPNLGINANLVIEDFTRKEEILS